MPPEGYQPLPPNPPEDNYRREVENQSDTGSVIAPPLDNSEGTLVTVENPTTSMSITPLEPLLVCLESLGNVIDEEVPQLPERILPKHIWDPQNQSLVMSIGLLFVLAPQ
jgi:hypothetical protein